MRELSIRLFYRPDRLFNFGLYVPVANRRDVVKLGRFANRHFVGFALADPLVGYVVFPAPNAVRNGGHVGESKLLRVLHEQESSASEARGPFEWMYG